MKRIDNLVFQIDGEVIDPKIIEKFNLRGFSRNLRFSYKLNAEVINFVGFIIKNKEMLVVLPKHYAGKGDLLDYSDVKLLFQILLKEQSKNVNKYIGSIKEFESSFPFKAFYSIYNYYQMYGLYKEDEKVIKPGYNGKISWKDTIRHSNNVISNGNLIYIPFFVQETKNRQVYLSECMAFAINYTLRTYPYFVKGTILKGQFSNFDFLGNRKHVIDNLKKIYSDMFSDKNKRLVKDLIDFYSNLPQGGNIKIVHYNFELVWESMVEKYLNDYFNDLGESGLQFEYKRYENQTNHFTKKKFRVDEAHPNHRLEPDHYLYTNNIQYIFDAKYYSHINELNYKQVAYHALLKKKAKRTYSALLLPTSGENRSRIHFELAKEFYTTPEGSIEIFEHYLNIKEVMENYLD
ncbi:hypothetical protein [Oceanobacillus sp. FSL W7-1293]|uniref:hypothetical protein n=1 Tax=unclassified Oceanobacillus TaxID=2630292 RepID=UPI0030D37437